MDRRLSGSLRTPNAEPAWRSAPSPHGAQHETVIGRRLVPMLPARFGGLSRMVARAAFESLFPGVPWADEGNDGGRGTALVDLYAPDGAVAYGGHFASLKARVAEEGESLPSKAFDVYGPSPNVGAAVQGLVRLHAEGKPIPLVATFRTSTNGGAVDNFRTLAWCGVDLPTLVADAIARVRREGPPVIKGVRWGVAFGLPECPPDMPRVGRGGYPGVTVYVTHPDSDALKRPNYRILRVTLRDFAFDVTTGEAGIAAWLAAEGFPTKARKR